ncbi:Hypothetical_protein [Hexamita inflata]|uniref:Hypothetical_protein n=1 Tax=Hexamita inflata TaxID=28002 RepID=A0AA86UR02_9EUKA|nr:Hypothetical protein HINF_LOCUS35103 [Hexamita inflata]
MKYLNLEIKDQHEDIQTTLIKQEYELVNNPVVQFVNNRTRELTLELTLKQMMLDGQKDNDQKAAQTIYQQKIRIQELEKFLIDEKIQHEQITNQKGQAQQNELTKCKLEIEEMKVQYAKDLKLQQLKHQKEIERLKQTIEADKQNEQQIIALQQQQNVLQIDINDTVANQLQQECNQLKQQLLDEKQNHDDQYAIMVDQLQRKNQRQAEIQKLLNEEKTLRLQYFQNRVVMNKVLQYYSLKVKISPFIIIQVPQKSKQKS